MSIRTIATLAIAVVLGLIAVIILNATLGGPRANKQTVASAGAPVVVAAQPILRGVALQAPLLKVVNFPQDSVPVGAFTSVQQLTGASGAGRLALRSLTPGEPILLTEVSGPGGRLNLATMIDPGMQAIAIRASDVTGVGGFVLPGDEVDVLLTRAISRGGDQPVYTVTQILAQNVKVVGVDQSDNDEATKPTVAKAVTIQVTPAQAQSITLGESVGSVSLALRHVADAMVLARTATTAGDLGFNPPLVRPATATPVSTDKPPAIPLYGPGVVRVTRVTDTTPYRVGGR
jgi:pilus assembly protein CpaB